MEEYKFRAWNAMAKKMLHFENGMMIMDSSDRYGMFFPVVENRMYMGGKYAIMQYIGLPDRDGKDIYEGDILQGMEANYCKQITWHNNGWKWVSILNKRGKEREAQSKKEYPKYEPTDIINLYLCRVIGNIYEQEVTT